MTNPSEFFEKAMIKNFGKMTESQKMVGRWAREWLKKRDSSDGYMMQASVYREEIANLRAENERLKAQADKLAEVLNDQVSGNLELQQQSFPKQFKDLNTYAAFMTPLKDLWQRGYKALNTYNQWKQESARSVLDIGLRSTIDWYKNE